MWKFGAVMAVAATLALAGCGDGTSGSEPTAEGFAEVWMEYACDGPCPEGAYDEAEYTEELRDVFEMYRDESCQFPSSQVQTSYERADHLDRISYEYVCPEKLE